MLKFVKREHYKQGAHRGKIVITYSLSEIVIGTLLVAATFLHIYIYIQTVDASKNNQYKPNIPATVIDQIKNNTPDQINKFSNKK